MRKTDDRRLIMRQHDLGHHGFEVGVVLTKALHVSLARVGDRALRETLAAPVECDGGEAAASQFAHGLEIFLNELRPPLKQADGAPVSTLGVPSRKSQRRAVAGLHFAGDGAVRNRIAGGWDQLHGLQSLKGPARPGS